jgi:hypothetical protein
VLELVHGAVEFAVDHGFVADEAVEVGGLGHDAARDFDGIAGDGAREGGHGGFGFSAGIFDGEHFKSGGSGQAPVTEGDALDNGVLESALWVELAADAFVEGVELCGGFGGVGFEDGESGE